ncbi:MAG: HAD family hydrolase [Candidatus Marinimicrobia bacterium]|jgi:phosphoglycolate phosphatase-like HAD superfamily hydrolase|nr:HAD family hydrolase [Candidatus Neomarinimicrobiota bacterium]MCK9559355.1 HAD family hydrolase [Candidatus Neomarinimicrobiota bacterium]MDD5061881.1 HAD family hydrolase [Candidatus Neomarinimicrobiota bacterium]
MNFEKRHEFLVAIDSDGCAFDTMEIKHKECFIPNIINYWNLQAVSKYARAAAEFVNLYSKWRGINRFPGLVMVFDLLKEWPEVQARKTAIPVAQSLRDWLARETKLGNPALKAEVERTGDPILKQALEWSEAVNADIARLVHDVPPFAFVRESLEKLQKVADVMVCSATPLEALRREWEEHDIARYTRVIAGQEIGSKNEQLAMAIDGRYKAENVLMIGDALGDLKAARGNSARFFSINPGHEERSWENFYKRYLDEFIYGKYDDQTEARLIAEFEEFLPAVPPWKK